MRSPTPDRAEGDPSTAFLNVFFDVDHTLLFSTSDESHLRPGAHEAMSRIKAAGHRVFVWSAGGAAYVERVVARHGLGAWVDGCFDKHPRVEPRPDFIIDDDWYLVDKYGGHLVSQYREIDPGDEELARALESFFGGLRPGTR